MPINTQNTGIAIKEDEQARQTYIVPDFLSALAEADFKSPDMLESYHFFGRAKLKNDARMYGHFCKGLEETLGVEGASDETKIDLVRQATSLAIGCLVEPPAGVEIFPRNPKQEIRRLAGLVVETKEESRPLSLVVPTCPDGNQYKLSDGIGKIGEKALEYAPIIRAFFALRGFTNLSYTIQIADVEGRDSAILEASGETTESHFAKTKTTMEKIRQEVVKRGLEDFVQVASMDHAFQSRGLDYLQMQQRAIPNIGESNRRQVRRTVDGLLAERQRLGDFREQDEYQMHQLTVAELAGYAAYGRLVNGSAVIVSPDAASAIPAYHFDISEPKQYSPVMYVRGQK